MHLYYICSIIPRMNHKRAFGELEAEILRILSSGERKTVKEVHAALGGSYTTIMTVMSRLASKKELAREKVGLQYAYWLNGSFLDRLKTKLFGIKPSLLLSHLIDAEVSDEELAEMEKLVKEAKVNKAQKRIADDLRSQ